MGLQPEGKQYVDNKRYFLKHKRENKKGITVSEEGQNFGGFSIGELNIVNQTYDKCKIAQYKKRPIFNTLMEKNQKNCYRAKVYNYGNIDESKLAQKTGGCNTFVFFREFRTFRFGTSFNKHKFGGLQFDFQANPHYS